MKRIVVVGAGITGLAAAHRLLELAGEQGRELDLRVLEAGDHAGGVIGTERRDGYVLEKGPDSLITDKPWAMDLIRRLGLQDRLIGTQDAHRRSFVVRDGKLMPVPEGFQLLAPTKFGPLAVTPIFSWPGKARMALDLLIPMRRDEADESLGAFVVRRLGREALERMAQPMIAGIYGGDPMELSLQATLPRFRDMEREHGSVIAGMWARSRKQAPGGSRPPGGDRNNGVSGARYGLFVSFREGMQTLPDALAARLPEGVLSLNTRVERVERSGESWSLALAGGETLQTDAVILALPAYHSGRLLESTDPDLARLLGEIRYASAATMTLCFRREDVPHPLDGFGFVVPSVEGFTLLGCTFSHVKWAHRAPEGKVLLRAFLGDAALRNRNEVELQRLVREDLRRLVGVRADPEFVFTWRGERVMPHYTVGHLDRVNEIERWAAGLPGLELAGNAYRGVGIPDSIHSGEEAAERVLAP